MSFFRTLVCIINPFARFFANMRVEGRENVPEGNVLVISNHAHYSDPVLIACAFNKSKKDIRFVAKSDLQRFGFFKWLFKAVKVIAIKRGESDRAALRECCSALNNGETVGIFPQGTRIKNEKHKAEQAKGGVGLIAAMTKAVVLPVAVRYTSPTARIFSRTTVIIGRPIPYEEYSQCNGEATSKTEMAQYCFGKVCDMLYGENDER